MSNKSHQFTLLKDGLAPSEVILVQDFAENRKSAYQDEPKQAHFGKSQITLHPTIAFYHNNEGQKVRHALNYVSDDTTHDHNAVHHFTRHTLQYLKQQEVLQNDTTVYIFSDGCSL